MAEALLYDLQHQAACAKIRVCLQLKGLAFRRVPASWRVRRSLGAAAGAALPILLHGGERLIGPEAILEHVEAVRAAPRLVPDEPGARAYCRLLDQWAERVLGRCVRDLLWQDAVQARRVALVTARELVPAPVARPLAAWLLRHRRRRSGGVGRPDARSELTAALALLESLLDGRPYLLGRTVTVADVAVYVQLARRHGLDLDRLPGLTAWRRRLESMTAVVTAVDP